MPRQPTTVLHSRADWSFVKFAYLPALIAGAVAAKLFWTVGAAAAFKFRINPCGLCSCLATWGHHFEEWLNAKPLMSIQDWGIAYENGDMLQEYSWSEIAGVVMFRRNEIPPWRTDGSIDIGPPYWLAIKVRPTDPEDAERYVKPFDEPDPPEVEEPPQTRYVKAYDEGDAPLEDEVVITFWPRQVSGGLFTLMRFGRELQRQLLIRADRGEIPKLLPDGA